MIQPLRKAATGQNLAIRATTGSLAVWTLLALPSALLVEAAQGRPVNLAGSLVLASLVILCVTAYGPVQRSWRQLGAANGVTLLRALLTCLLASVVGATAATDSLAWSIFAIATVALLLDGLDGWIARRRGEQSDFGARFDMETDAFLLVMLSLLVLDAGKAGLWVLLSGLLRYLFIAAGQIWPWLQGPLPPSQRRKAVCALQTAALVACLAPVVSAEVAAALALSGLAALALSFAIDILWLKSHSKMGDAT